MGIKVRALRHFLGEKNERVVGHETVSPKQVFECEETRAKTLRRLGLVEFVKSDAAPAAPTPNDGGTKDKGNAPANKDRGAPPRTKGEGGGKKEETAADLV